MRYKKELLLLNVENFTLEDVVDFDATHDKWDFLKCDTFNWDNHLQAREKELITEDDAIIYHEHSSSIETEISTVARIFSISLNQCFKRKTLLEQLKFNSLQYESVLNSLHFVITQYETTIKEIDKEIQAQSTKTHEYDNKNSVLNVFRDSVDKARQNFFHGLEHYKTAYTKMTSYLQNIKTETEKYHSTLQQAIELADVRLQTEIEIKDRAQEKMHTMRKEYLHSVTHYNRLGSTVPEEEEEESADMENTTDTTAASSKAEEVASSA